MDKDPSKNLDCHKQQLLENLKSTMTSCSYVINNILPYCKDIPVDGDKAIPLFSTLCEHLLKVRAFKHSQSTIENIALFCDTISQITADLRSATTPYDSVFAIVFAKALEALGYLGQSNKDTLLLLHQNYKSEVNSCLSKNFLQPVIILEDNIYKQMRHFISQNPTVETLWNLITSCPSVDVEMLTNENHQSVIHIIAMADQDDFELTSLFIKRIERRNLSHFVNLQRTDDGNTALHLASKNGKINIVKCLIENGANTSLLDSLSQTVLNVSANDSISKLIRKANLFDSSTRAHAHIFTSLLQRTNLELEDEEEEEEEPPKNDFDLLDRAIDCADVAMVKEILTRNKACVNERSQLGMTPLMKAIGLGDDDIVQILLENGADTSAFHRNLNALHYAVKKGDEQIVDILLSHIKDVNVPTEGMRQSALHLASENGHLALVKLLLAHGANFEQENEISITPLDVSINGDVTNLLTTIENLHEIIQDGIVDGEDCLNDLMSKCKQPQDYDVFLKATNHMGKTAVQLMVEKKGPLYLMFKKLYLCSSDSSEGS